MKTQYDALRELKEVDDRRVRIQADIERIPLELNACLKELSEREQEFKKAKELFDSYEKQFRKVEMDLKEKEDFLRKAEGKMMEVKTNEEYQAAMKENETHKTEKSRLEDKVLELMGEIEARRKILADAERVFKEHEAAAKQTQKKLEQEKAALVARHDEQLKLRDSALERTNPEIVAIYKRVSLSFQGKPMSCIAVVRDCICVACNVKVRPQLYNEILGHKAFHRCSSCGRLLITEATQSDDNDAEDR